MASPGWLAASSGWPDTASNGHGPPSGWLPLSEGPEGDQNKFRAKIKEWSDELPLP